MARVTALLAVLASTTAYIHIVERPMMLYSTASPKLHIEAKEPSFANIPADHIDLKFTPSLKPSAYNLSIVSDTVISLALRSGKKWGNPHTTDGMTLYLNELRINFGVNMLRDEKVVAQIIPTPTIKSGADTVIYTKGTSKLVINGANFRSKEFELMFDPPLHRDEHYRLSLQSSTSMVLTRTTGTSWRSEPGPLKLRSINTGAGTLPIDPSYGGIVVAMVQADLGAYGVTVESTPDEKLYQSTGSLIIIGEGFNEVHNTLRFANGLLDKGVDYTTVEHTKNQIKLDLAKKSKWRANPANLPGPLVLLAVDPGAGFFVPVGPTEAKKGRTVATIFEDPSVTKSTKTIYMSHTHQLWVAGSGFTTAPHYSTSITLDPPLEVGEDYSLFVYNRTHMLLSLFEGKQWKKGSDGKLKIKSMNTGAGDFPLKNGIQIANVEADEVQEEEADEVQEEEADEVQEESICDRHEHAIASLEQQVASLTKAVAELQKNAAEPRPHDFPKAPSAQGFPLTYKIKAMTSMQRAATGSMFSFLLQKFTIFAGDRKLGVIGERSILKKLIRDHVSLTGTNGKLVADFDENVFRSWRPTYWGCQSFNLYDYEAGRRRILNGIQESYWTSWWRGERQGLEFTSGSGVQYVSRKVNTVTEGMNKWHIVEALSGDKVAVMEESVVEAAGGVVSSGWLIMVERGVDFDPRIPAFFAAYELTERTTTYLDFVQGCVFTVFIGCALVAALAAAGVMLGFGPGRNMLQREHED